MKTLITLPLFISAFIAYVPAGAETEPKSPTALSWEKTELSLPFFSQEKKGMKPGKLGLMAMHNGGAWFPKNNSKREFLGERSYPMIVLQQKRFTVEILPGNASVIHRVTEADGTDWFYREQRIKDWIPWWESGVKASFPFMEHGVREAQPSAWQVIQEGDEHIRFSSWMEFSRYHSIQESVQFGRHSNMMLEQEIEVRPGDPRLRLTYRVTNPAYYKQGLQVWNDAFWPRFHHPEGVVHGGTDLQFPDDAELIGAMDWASDHLGQKFQAFDPDTHNPRNTRQENFSYFIWDVQDGWTGLYYPSVDVARIRLVDPEAAPGTKWWWHKTGSQSDVNHNFIEMWGGSDHVFEGVERWLGPGQQWEATWTYLYVQGIGKPVAANDHAILAMKENVVTAVTYEELEKAELWVNGAKQKMGMISFDAPLSVDVEDPKQLELRSRGQVLLNITLPRTPLPMREEIKKQITDSLDYENPVGNEMQGNQHTRGRFYRNAKYPGNTLGHARVRIRDGDLESAIHHVKAFLEQHPESGEGWYLLGAVSLEMENRDEAGPALEKALKVKEPEPAALYLLAVLSLTAEEPEIANAYLNRLLQKLPAHQEGRLLKAFLAEDASEALGLVQKHPADPRIRWVAREVAKRTGVDHERHQKVLNTLLAQEPGAEARVNEFQSITEGRLIHPQRLDPQQ